MTNKRPVNDFINEFADNELKSEFELYDLLYNISIKIFDYRIEKKMSQKDFAKLLGVSQVMVSKLESGEYNPTIELLWKISSKLGWKLNISFEKEEVKEEKESETNLWDEQDYNIGNILYGGF